MHDVVLDALAKGGGGGGGGGAPALGPIYLSSAFVSTFIPASAVIAIIFALFMWWRVSQISVGGGSGNREYLLEAGGDEVRSIAVCSLALSPLPPPDTLGNVIVPAAFFAPSRAPGPRGARSMLLGHAPFVTPVAEAGSRA